MGVRYSEIRRGDERDESLFWACFRDGTRLSGPYKATKATRRVGKRRKMCDEDEATKRFENIDDGTSSIMATTKI